MLNSAECKVEFAVKAFTGVFTVPMFQIGKGSFFLCAVANILILEAQLFIQTLNFAI